MHNYDSDDKGCTFAVILECSQFWILDACPIFQKVWDAGIYWRVRIMPIRSSKTGSVNRSRRLAPKWTEMNGDCAVCHLLCGCDSSKTWGSGWDWSWLRGDNDWCGCAVCNNIVWHDTGMRRGVNSVIPGACKLDIFSTRRSIMHMEMFYDRYILSLTCCNSVQHVQCIKV